MRKSGASCTIIGGGPPASPLCAHAVDTSGPGAGRDGGASREHPVRQCGANLAHEMEVEVQVVQGRELRAEHLVRQMQVSERPTAEATTAVAGALVVDRSGIARVTGVADHQLA